MIKEVCNRLKEKRSELGYSIEYTVEKTKLYPSVIRDIEQGNLSNISSVYLKGFMKIYASFLGVDLGTALEEVNSLPRTRKKIVKVKKLDTPSPINDIVGILKRIPAEAKKKIIFVFIGAIVVLSIFFIGRGIVRKISGIFKRNPKEVKVAGNSKVIASSETTQGVEASLTIKKKCFLRVTADGKILFEGILNKGMVETWKADKLIELRLSDGSAVSLEVNGKIIPTLASIHKPIKSIKITPSGISVDK